MGRCPGFPTTKNLEALVYGRQIRALSGGSIRVQAQPAGSKWQSARPTRLGLPRTFVLRNYMNDLLFRAQT